MYYTKQVSKSSEQSEHSQDLPVATSSGTLNPPIDSVNRLQGPSLGSSPLGTPVHQSSEPTQPPSPLSQASHPPEPPTSIPSSPFSQTNSETAKGSSSVFAQFGAGGPADDAFTSILSMSDSDRRHDAWIPSDATCHILKSMVTSHPGTFQASADQLSTPGLLTSEPQVNYHTHTKQGCIFFYLSVLLSGCYLALCHVPIVWLMAWLVRQLKFAALFIICVLLTYNNVVFSLVC